MEYRGYRVIELNDEELANHYSNKYVDDFLENEYLIITQKGEIIDINNYQDGKIRGLRAFEIGDSYTDIWKPKNIEQSLAFDLVEDKKVPVKLLTGRYGSGKAQPISTLIPTPKGWRKLGKLKVGDKVFDRTGKETKILEIFPQGEKTNYKITFSDGRHTFCNNEHIWGCLTERGNLINLFTVNDMLEEGLEENGKYKFKIPVCDPVQYSTKNFGIDPYIVGILLGKGIKVEKNLEIICENEEIIKQLATIFKCDYKKSGNENGWIFVSKKVLRDVYGRPVVVSFTEENFPFKEFFKYIELNEIPKNFLFGDVYQRQSLLQGLLDAAGAVEVNKGVISFCSSNYKLIEGIQRLYYSLGYVVELTKYKKDDIYVFKIATHISIVEKDLLLRIESKKELARKMQISSTGENKSLAITKIEKMNKKVEMVCILVDNDEHLYLTNDYLVTHNTGILCKAGIAAVRKGEFDKLLWVRNNIEVKDTNPLGSLPGDLLQKMWWTAGPLIDHCGGEFGLERLIEEGRVEIAYLGHLRGRDIRNSLIICSEAENLTKQHLQLLLGRVGEGSNLWLDADLRQRDKQIFEKTAGIENMIEKLKGNPLFGYIHLEKTERSATACLADLLDE